MTPKLFKVIAPKNSSFFGKIGEAKTSCIYQKTSSVWGIKYLLSFAKNPARVKLSEQSYFYDYQLTPVKPERNNAIKGSQESLL